MENLHIPLVPLNEKDIRKAVQGAKTLAIGDKVFAKWVQRTDVRYWPGKLKNKRKNIKHHIHDYDCNL